jgi:hypothetical protein
VVSCGGSAATDCIPRQGARALAEERRHFQARFYAAPI